MGSVLLFSLHAPPPHLQALLDPAGLGGSSAPQRQEGGEGVSAARPPNAALRPHRARDPTQEKRDRLMMPNGTPSRIFWSRTGTFEVFREKATRKRLDWREHHDQNKNLTNDGGHFVQTSYELAQKTTHTHSYTHSLCLKIQVNLSSELQALSCHQEYNFMLIKTEALS